MPDVDIDSLFGGQRDRAAAMDGDRFRDLREAMGVSLNDLASLLGMRGRHAATHLREMEDGVRPIPGPTGVALQALASGWRPGLIDLDEIDNLIADCTRLAESPTCRPVPMTIEGCEPGGYNGYGRALRDCSAMLRRLTGRS